MAVSRCHFGVRVSASSRCSLATAAAVLLCPMCTLLAVVHWHVGCSVVFGFDGSGDKFYLIDKIEFI